MGGLRPARGGSRRVAAGSQYIAKMEVGVRISLGFPNFNLRFAPRSRVPRYPPHPRQNAPEGGAGAPAWAVATDAVSLRAQRAELSGFAAGCLQSLPALFKRFYGRDEAQNWSA